MAKQTYEYFIHNVFSKQNMCASRSNFESVEQSRYAGCVVEWHGSYGLISCMKIASKVRTLGTASLLGGGVRLEIEITFFECTFVL